MNKISVILADDHTLVRRGFRRLLEDDPAITVAGEAGNGDEAIRLARALKPQVIVMDCAMPGTSGLTATEKILAENPAIAVVMLSMHSEATLVRQALDAGARGYILKDAIDLDLAAAVKKAVGGQLVIDPKLVKPAALKGERDHGLSPRELEVLRHICDGLSNRAIAEKLGLSVNTVAVHRANIMKTLDVHKTAELVVYAIQNGLVNPL